MKNAAVYIRVSTDDQVEYSPDSQLTEIKNYAKRHDMLIDPSHIYTDAGISGRNARKRPQFQKMIANAKEKPSPFDVILVWKFSRFARNQEESILYKSLLRRENNIEVVSITEETGDNMFGPLIERIIEWMDEFYSIRLGEEVRTKMTYVAEKGRFQTSPSFGWNKIPNQDVLQINPVESKWCSYMRRAALRGDSMLSIARELNRNGVKTKRGNQFDARAVEYILRNPMQIGCVRWTPTGKMLSKRIYDSPDTITSKSDQVPPICSEDEFQAVQKELNRRKALRKKYDKPEDVQKHWLSGIVRCSNCGSTLSYSPANHGFQCWKYAKGLCSVSHYISAPKLEAAVVKALERVVVTDEFIKENTRPVEPAGLFDYAEQLEHLEKMLERAKQAYVRGIDNIDEYSVNKTRIQAEIDQIKSLQRKAETKMEYPTEEEVNNRIIDVITLIKGDSDKKIKHESILSISSSVEFSRLTGSIKIDFSL